MSEQNWKPGDVAMVAGDVAIRAQYGCDAAFIDGLGRHWRNEDDTARPLVVIDLGSDALPHAAGRTEGQLLVSMLRETAENFFTPDAAELANRIADQIEAQIEPPAPPRPDEPMGLGAVVEDDEGEKWVRWSLGEWPDRAPWRADGPKPDHRRWDGIKAVRVLSEGVNP